MRLLRSVLPLALAMGLVSVGNLVAKATDFVAAGAPFSASIKTPRAPSWTAESNQTYAYLGEVSGNGDVNGDGFDDIIVGAPFYDGNGLDQGRALAFYGSAAGLSKGPSWSAGSDQLGGHFGTSVALPGDVNGDGFGDAIVGGGQVVAYHGSRQGLGTIPNWTVESDQADSFGSSIAGAGDVNGDGYADVLVGAWGHDNDQYDEGRVLAYYGSASGLSVAPNWIEEGDQDFGHFGVAVAGAGDVNGDHYDDVVVGATNGESDAGRAVAYYGSAAGLGNTPDWIVESDQFQAQFGYSVAGSGDVNGDGFDDVVIGAIRHDGGQAEEGGIFAYYGSPEGLGASPSWSAESDQAGAWFGYSLALAGDSNDDGYDELLVGAPQFDQGQTDEGKSFMFCGSAIGLGIKSCKGGQSNQEDAFFGSSVAGAGDVNGDGYEDRLVGASSYDHGQVDEGVAVLKLGSAG